MTDFAAEADHFNSSQLKDFIDILVEKICIANYKWKVDARFSDLMKKKIDDVKKKKSEESRNVLKKK